MREGNVLQDGMPALVAIIIQQITTEFEVFRMRAQRGSGQSPPSIVGAVFLSEHLGHTGPIGASQVKCDMILADGQVMWQATVEPRSVDMHRFRTYGWACGQSVGQLGRQAIGDVRRHRQDRVGANGYIRWGLIARSCPGLGRPVKGRALLAGDCKVSRHLPLM